MKKFKYTAVNLHGKKFQGIYLAENEKDLREQLQKQNLFLVSSKVKTDKSPSPFFSVSGKASVAELSTFARQFSVMLTSGTSIVDSIAVLRAQSYSSYFRKVLEQVYESIKSGALLSEAMAKHKKAFPNFFVSMVRIGELSGQIDTVLISVADYFESDAKIRAKTKSAMMYPTFLIFMALAIIILLVTFIIPTFQNALSSLDVEMPKLTLALYDISAFVIKNWKYLLLGVAAVVALFLLIINTKKGRLYWDKFKFHLPYIGNIIKCNISARFCRSVSLLVSSGMDVADAIDEVVVVMGNKYVEQQFRLAAEDVRGGMTLTFALQQYKLFPDMLIQMVSVGEKTGQLDATLGRSCSYFENQVERSLTALTTMIQPVILIVIGASVGVLFYAVYSPLLQIMNTLK